MSPCTVVVQILYITVLVQFKQFLILPATKSILGDVAQLANVMKKTIKKITFTSKCRRKILKIPYCKFTYCTIQGKQRFEIPQLHLKFLPKVI